MQKGNKGNKWKKLGVIHKLPADCFGDELYNHMVARGWVDNMDNYDVKGDSSRVYVVGKRVKDGEFIWEFKQTD